MFSDEYMQLRREISTLRDKIICHEYLFNDLKDDFDNIVKFSPAFFGFFQRELQYGIILHIGRLFDKRNDTFSIEKFIRNAFSKDSIKLDKYLKLLQELKIYLKPIINWRMNAVAHKNYNVIFKKSILPKMNNNILKTAIDKITDFYYKIEEGFTDNHDRIDLDYLNGRMRMSLRSLIKNIKRANAYDKLILCGMYELIDESNILNMTNDNLKKQIANKSLKLTRPAKALGF